MRLSLNSRSRTNSILPVPLNSSKITPSILLPVSIKAVAIIDKLPPSSVFLAAPKNFFGFLSAFESTPPDNILPLCGITALCARPNLVILSNRITTSLPHSTNLCALARAISDTCTCLSGPSSNVDAITSASTLLFISVTSSGLSSIRRMIRTVLG